MYSKKINQLATNLNPQPTDLLPIGDAETGQLKTTTFGSVSGVTGDGVISGGIVTWTGTGLIFNISACTYILNGIRYSSPFSTKTLAAADPTNPRIDVFAVNESSLVEVIQGTPASNPVEPEGDTATTLGLTNVTINAGATTPNNVTRDLIYDENVETWTKTFTQSSASVDYANTTSPNTGTKCILVTMGAGFINLNFSKAVALDISNYKSLSFAIRCNSAWTENTILGVRFLNGTNNVSNLFQIGATNNVGFNRNLAGAYQIITIPFNNTNLKFTNNAFTTIRISTQNAAVTYRLDTIQLNGGINNPTGGGTTPSNSFGFVNGTTGTASSTTATDTLNVVGSGLITTSATGKTLTIASNQIATSSILGRVTASTGNIETLTGTQATTLLDVFTSSLKGLAPASGGGTTNFLRADGTWAAPSGGTTIYTGDGTLTSNRTLTLGGFSLTFTGSRTATGAIARGLYLNNTLVAAANSDVLVGLDILSTFTNGAFTGVSNIPLRVQGTTNTNFFSSGNLVLNSTTDAGFKIDVNGTARVSGKITANGSTSSTSGLDVGTLRFQHFATNNAFIAENAFYNGSAWQRVNTGMASVYYFTGGGFNVGTLTSAAGGTTQAALNTRMNLTNTGELAISDTISGGGAITMIASAVLQADSTTKGFLPPRMTTTQKNAIATPAAGLIVYDTTLAKLCVRTASAWETITSL